MSKEKTPQKALNCLLISSGVIFGHSSTADIHIDHVGEKQM